MAQDEIKMDYPLMDEMKRTFAEGRENLGDVANQLKGLADKIDDGALLGSAGDAFAGAVRGALMTAVQRLSDKFEELEADIQFAVDQMHQAEEKTKASF